MLSVDSCARGELLKDVQTAGHRVMTFLKAIACISHLNLIE